MRHRRDALWNELRQHAVRPEQLRRLRPDVHRDAGVHGRRVHRDVHRTHDDVRRELRKHPDRQCELWRLWHGVHRRPSVFDRDLLGHVCGAHADVWGSMRRPADGQQQLRRVRDGLRVGNALLRRNVREHVCRPDAHVWRVVHRRSDGSRQLRRMRHGVSRRSGLHGRRVSPCLHGAVDRVRRGRSDDLREHRERHRKLRIVRTRLPIGAGLHGRNLRCDGGSMRDIVGLRRVCNARDVRLVLGNGSLPDRNGHGIDDGRRVHGLELVLHDDGLRGRSVQLRNRLRYLRRADQLRLVHGDRSLPERDVHRFDCGTDVFGRAVVLDDERVRYGSLCVEHVVRNVLCTRRLRLVLEHGHLSKWQLDRSDARWHLHRCELVLDHDAMRVGPLRIEHDVCALYATRRLRLVLCLRQVPERDGDDVDRRRDVLGCAVGLHRLVVPGGSLPLRKQHVLVVRCTGKLRLLQHDPRLPNRNLRGQHDGRRLYRRRVELHGVIVRGGSVQLEHDVRVVCGAIGLRILHRERNVPVGRRVRQHGRWRVQRNELGLPDQRMPAVTAARRRGDRQRVSASIATASHRH